jgi:hypothetical protein
MKTGTFLDMDMAQLRGSLGGLYRWWVDELAAMVPPKWRGRDRRRLAGLCAYAGAGGGFSVDGEALALGAAKVLPATIVLAPNRALFRTVTLPALRRADLRKLVTLDLDRLMPFPPGTAFADVITTGLKREDGRVDARIAAIPQNELVAVYQNALEHGLAPRAIGIADSEGDALEFDFLPALITGGYAAPLKGARGWWALVALLFVANIGVMVWKDARRNAELRALVEAQQPLVNAARKIGQRMTGEDQTRAELLQARRNGDALATLALVTRAVPAGAWVQRYSATSEGLRISGYKQPAVDVLGALRKTGAFASVRATTADIAGESATGQPFDITAAWAQ